MTWDLRSLFRRAPPAESVFNPNWYNLTQFFIFTPVRPHYALGAYDPDPDFNILTQHPRDARWDLERARDYGAKREFPNWPEWNPEVHPPTALVVSEEDLVEERSAAKQDEKSDTRYVSNSMDLVEAPEFPEEREWLTVAVSRGVGGEVAIPRRALFYLASIHTKCRVNTGYWEAYQNYTGDINAIVMDQDNATRAVAQIRRFIGLNPLLLKDHNRLARSMNRHLKGKCRIPTLPEERTLVPKEGELVNPPGTPEQAEPDYPPTQYPIRSLRSRITRWDQ